MNKTLASLRRQRIAFVGLGSENLTLINYLCLHGLLPGVNIFEFNDFKTISNRYPEIKRWKNIKWYADDVTFDNLSGFSLIVRSPGAYFDSKLRRQLAQAKIKLVSPMQLFLELSPTKNIIGVTGTKGKGTTSSLIQAVLKGAGKRVWLGGNIGIAPFSFISKIQKTDWVVLELSSFQLQDMTSSPRIAVFTNFSSEHLVAADPHNPNHHPSLKNYWDAKLNLARYQNKSGIVIANEKLKHRLQRERLAGKIVYTKASVLPTSLPGSHNRENIALVEVVAGVVGLPKARVAKTIATFKGLPYRLEKVADKKGIAYYNDSFSTVPASTITALKSFEGPIILLAGGADKGSNFTAVAREIKRRAKTVILFKGPGSTRLKSALKKTGYTKRINEANNMKQALALARKAATPGDIILLSPGCASFGMFKNYKDRGEQFNKATR